MDFVADSLSDGLRIRVLTIIDSFTRECFALKVARSLPSQSVTAALNRVIEQRGAPRTIQVDNGTEFTSNHFDAWAYLRGIDVDFIRPGKPVDNAHPNGRQLLTPNDPSRSPDGLLHP
jgi:putative transposase